MGRASCTTTCRTWARAALVCGVAITSGVAIGATPASPVYAVTITVTSNIDIVSNDGVCTLREAITSAGTNTASGAMAGECPAGAAGPTIDQIVLDATTYELKSGLPPLPVINEPLLIQGNSATIDANALHRVFENYSSLELFALTLQNGLATGAGNAGVGGAIYNNGTLKTSAVTFTNNEANLGGAIYNSGTIDLGSSHFTDNTANAGGAIVTAPGSTSGIYGGSFTGNHAQVGGALALSGGVTTISDTAPGPISFSAPSFSNNHADIDLGGLMFGGAIYQDGGSVVITGADFTLNSATDGGGAIWTYANATIDRSNISGNSSSQGGGVAAGSGSTVDVTDSVIHNNDAVGNSGGGILAIESTVDLVRSTVSGNTAAGYGGGIYGALSTAVVNVTNSTISGNVATAGGGGGISSQGTLTVTHSTIASNEGNEAGGFDDAGGVQTWGGTASTTITASIVADNTTASVDGGPTNDVGMRNTTIDGYTSGGGNVIESVLETTIGPAGAITAFDGDDDRVGVDPGLAALAGNGGPTETHAITATSPAIDLVRVTVPATPSTDQRGEPRVQGTLADAGAYELSCASAPTNIADGNDWLFAIGCFNEPTVTTPVALTLTGNPVVGATAVVDNSGTTLSIDGPAQAVTGDGFVGSLLRIEPGSDVSLTGFSMTGGDAGNGNGGAIDNAGTLSAENMTLNGNSTDNGIGGSINNSGTATLTRVAINDSSAFWGGGIANSGTLDIFESGISDNTAFGRGGGIYHPSGVLDVDRSLISGNRSGEALGASGGGIWTAAAATITNSTISGNSAVGEGGAIEHDNGPLLVEFSTVTDNAVDGAGTGGIRTGATVGAMSLRASIVHGNANLDLDKAPGSAAIGDLGANVLGALGATVTEFTDGDTEGNRVGVDPQLGPLAGNGGPTFTHAIGGSSPAVDLVVTPDADDPAVDQRGVTRPALGFSDAGAFEGECGDFSFPWVVSESAQWPRAIECYNALTAPGSYLIEIATDIVADALTSIDNGTAGVELVVDGGGHSLSAASADNAVSVWNSNVVEITDLTITHEDGVSGRGVNNAGELVMRRVAVIGNDASANGGGLNNFATATAVIIDSLITGNTAGDGAGIRTAGDLTLINSTVTGNVADADGGGLLVTANGTASIEFSTITGNSALDGGGIGVDDGGTVTLVASIVAENSSPDLAATSGSSDPFTRDAFNVLGVLGSFIGTGAATDLEGVTDAGLESLAENGGPTMTHALEPASPALDFVTATVGTDPAVDQRGNARPVADAKDAGAFEASCATSPWVASSENTLRHALTCFDAVASGNHTIELSADIDLTRSLPVIDNANASLEIDGNDFAVDGGSNGFTSADGFRIFEIDAGGTVSVRALEVLGGDAQGDPGGGFSNAGALSLTEVLVADNVADSGGGISSTGTLTIVDSTISSNRNNGAIDEPGGAGIHIDGAGTLELTGSTVSGNDSTSTGGGISTTSTGTVTIDSSLISDNSAAYGGGIAAEGPTEVVNTTVSGHSCSCVGAGIYVGDGGTLDLLFSTITDNSALPLGDGIAAVGSQPGSVTVTASIIAGNSDGSEDVATSGSGDPYVSGGFNVVGGIDSDVTAFASDLTDTDPLLAGLGNNGGPTSSHALLTGSPAIGLVTGSVTGAPDVDQRGTARPQFVFADAGAYECTDAFCDADADGDGDTDSVDNCPVDANADQADADGDGVGDVCDLLQDSDGDLVADDVDNCPADANADQADADGDGVGDVCDPTPDPDPDPVDAEVFTSLDPARFADSRDETTFDGQFLNTGPRGSDSTWEIDIAGRGDVPADAAAVIVNLTVLNGTGPGFATAYPCGDLPNASSVNYSAGTVEPNEVIAKLSSSGTLCVYTLTQADVIVDVVGYVSNTSPYEPITPTRYADSRNEDTFDDQFRDTGIRQSGTTWEIDVAGRGTIPATATTVVANITITAGTGPGFATIYPCTDDVPNASSLNYDIGVTIPNEVVTKLSDTGTLCVFTLTDTHVIVDIVGYLEPTTAFTPIVPTRYADSRNENTFDDQFRDTGIRQSGTTWEIDIAGRGTIPTNATTAVANITVTDTTGPGFATVYPCTNEPPNASSINYGLNTTRPNEVITKLSPTGTICIYTLTATHLIIDITGHNGT